MSRRTVYAYFPTLEQLLLDATLGMLSQTAVDDAIDDAIGAADDGGVPEQRVQAMIRALSAMASETLPLGRSLIRLTVEAPSGGEDRSPVRGYRRITWLERALEPLRDVLDPPAFERLVSSLAMVVGWEALIVLQDLRGLGPDEELEVTLWTARTLIRAALDDAGHSD